jgi:hypothetical protein
MGIIGDCQNLQQARFGLTVLLFFLSYADQELEAAAYRSPAFLDLESRLLPIQHVLTKLAATFQIEALKYMKAFMEELKKEEVSKRLSGYDARPAHTKRFDDPDLLRIHFGRIAYQVVAHAEHKCTLWELGAAIFRLTRIVPHDSFSFQSLEQSHANRLMMVKQKVEPHQSQTSRNDITDARRIAARKRG